MFECLRSTRNNFKHRTSPVATQVPPTVCVDQASQTGDEFILSLQAHRTLRNYGGAVSLPDLSLVCDSADTGEAASAASPALPAPVARSGPEHGAIPKTPQFGSTDVRERRKMKKSAAVQSSSPGLLLLVRFCLSQSYIFYLCSCLYCGGS